MTSRSDELDDVEPEFVNIISEGNDTNNIGDDLILKSEVEPKPQGKVAQACWRLRAVRRTLKNGGYLTKRVYIPSKIYSQIGCKVAGLTFKIDCYTKASSLMQSFIENRTSHNPPCIKDDIKELQETLKNIENLCNELNNIQDKLHRAFPSLISHSIGSSSGNENNNSVKVADIQNDTQIVSSTTTTNETQPQHNNLLVGFWGAAAGRTKAFTSKALALTRNAAEASTEIVGSAGISAISAVRFSLLPVYIYTHF